MESQTSDGPDTSEKEVIEEAATKSLTGVEATEPLREDQIQNAISFLNHPKVQGSSQAAKTQFLEKKGLTSAEITEAFSRAGSSGTTAIASTASPALPQAPRPGYNGTQATISALQPRQVLQQMVPVSRSLRWTQVVLGASVVVAGAYALKQLVTPIASRWYRQFYGIQEPESLSEKSRQQESRTAELIAAAIESQTKELRATIDSLKDMVSKLESRKQEEASEAAGISVEDLRSELHAFASTLSSLGPSSRQPDSELKTELAQIKQLLSSKSSGNSQSIPASPKAKSIGSAYPPYQGNGVRVGPPAARAHHQADVSASGDSEPSQPSYMEVLEMLERGETPPNVRTDINDKPPNPNQALPNASNAPRPKPWERAGTSSSSSNPGQPVITDSEDDHTPVHHHRKKPTGPWRPPPVPQASVPKPASIASEADSEAASLHADKIEEIDS